MVRKFKYSIYVLATGKIESGIERTISKNKAEINLNKKFGKFEFISIVEIVK